ncbi:L,D-transpeptidase family protein [Pseudobacteroides cellulosolvens]|uniref:L,D-transpeptidase family protein n=1 Tax=Pseudobacteroides cellulosolvens TaxID=35825 RepID=UPI00055C79F0|nr:L,D-transpeptidase family protein [Pseudobacteroides cellulosolvens]
MIVIIKKGQLFLLISLILVTLVFEGGYRIYYMENSKARHAIKNQPEYMILVQVDEKTLYLFEDGKCIKQYMIASGHPKWPSPIGNWKIINKSKWGEGFGGRWMGLNVQWGEYGIHGTMDQGSIGRAASHGCIRMFNRDVKELYDIVPIGTPVIIKNGTFGPFGTGFRKLMPGDRGADVLAVQKRLKELGYFKGYESGIYEDDLKRALIKFLKDNNLKVDTSITRRVYNAMGFKEFE